MLKRVSFIFIIVLAIFAGVAIGALVTSQQATNAACEEANDVRVVLTRIISRAKITSAGNEEFNQSEKEVQDDFYTEALHELKNRHC
jgi:type II secretory pathway pseudopilin PulG